MTNKDAITCLKNIRFYIFDSRWDEALEKGIEALEKQIPKEPTYEGDGYAPDGSFVWDEWLCPKCGSRYEVDFDDYNHCPNCGQAIRMNPSEQKCEGCIYFGRASDAPDAVDKDCMWIPSENEEERPCDYRR